LEGNGRKEVLAGAELGSAVALGIEADKWLKEEEIPQAWFSICTRTARA
jgi:hypothetical protein